LALASKTSLIIRILRASPNVERKKVFPQAKLAQIGAASPGYNADMDATSHQ
jgi:hypothetical protein